MRILYTRCAATLLLLGCALFLFSCANRHSSFQIHIPQGDRYLSLEQELFQSAAGAVQMGYLGRGAGSRAAYDFTFGLKGTDAIRYAYLSVDTQGVDRPQNPIFLNGHPIGFLNRAGYLKGGNVVYAGEGGKKKKTLHARTQRYLPAEYFRPGTNVLRFGQQSGQRSSHTGKIEFEKYEITGINLSVFKLGSVDTVPSFSGGPGGARRFPEPFEFFAGLTDEELYVALVKLPYLLAEISDPGSGAAGSLGYVYSKIGNYYRWAGRYKKSLDYHLKAIDHQEKEGLTLLTPRIRSELAMAHYFVGDYPRAIGICETALSEIDALRAQPEQSGGADGGKKDHLESLIHAYLAMNHGQMGDASNAGYHAYRVIGDFNDDWAYFETRRTEIGKYLPISLAHQAMGDDALRGARFDEALDHYEKARQYLGFETRPEIFNDQMIIIRIGIAKALFHKKAYDRSLEMLNGVARPTNAFMWRSHLLRGMIAEARNDLEQAATQYLAAISEIEFSRTRLTSHGFKINFMTDKQEPYARMVHCLVRLKQGAEAFKYAEKAKARAFLDLIAESEKIIGQKNDILSELTMEEKRLRETLVNVQHQQDMSVRMFRDRSIDGDTGQRVEAARGALGDFFARIFKENKDYKSLRSAETIGAAEVRALLGEASCLVEYYYHKDRLYAWVLASGGFQLVVRTVPESDLIEMVRTYRELLGNPQITDPSGGTVHGDGGEMNATGMQRLSARLSGLLVDGIFDGMAGKIVYVIPHGILHYLPFQALSMNGKYMVEQLQIGYSPSASVLKHVFEKKKNRSGSILALGNPDLGVPGAALPAAEGEVADIRGLFTSATVFTRKQATEAAFKKNASKYAMLHIASHGEFNPGAPLQSCLRLAPGEGEDGRLEAREIFDLDLNADLVSMSACNTALGKMTRGDELIGLTRAFLFSGTPSILGTFWSVSDDSTRLLMRHFYTNLKTMNKFEAIQKAQTALIRDEKFSHPFFWAGFQMIGDYR
jgi:tetratricopeptide (TPR) repeat protein